jgi:hypothetical protein
MSAFCGKCGKPLDGGRFCPACGADSAEPIFATTAGAASSSAANVGAEGAVGPMSRATSAGAAGAGVAAPAKSSNTLLIVLLIVVVIFGGIGAVVIYAAYWAKNKVVSTAKDYGVELPSDAHSRGRKSASAAAHRDPCSFLSAAEAAAATGIAITEAHTENQTCNFASADGTGAGAFVEFEWGSGKILMSATRAGGKLMTMAPGTELQSVDGVGDEAFFQNGMLTVRHGEDAFRIMMPAELLSKNLGSANRTVLDNIADMREIEKRLAGKIVSRM